MKGKPASLWLKDITKDQNLDRIEDLPRTLMTGFRRWFASRILQGFLHVGYYDPATGRFVLGPADGRQIVTDTIVDVVSDADQTFTCPADTAWRVVLATVRSARAPTCSLTYTPNGGTATILSNAAAGVINTTVVLIGGKTSNGGNASMQTYLWMQAGDTLTLSIDNFVAADVVRKAIIMEVYAV